MELFTKKKEDDPKGLTPPPIEKSSNDISRRIRLNEERNANMRKKVQMIEHNMLAQQKKMLTEIKYVNEEIGEVKRSIEELKQTILGLNRQVQEGAKKEDLQVLERYINMWEPIKFVTRKEVERVVNDKMREQSLNSSKTD